MVRVDEGVTQIIVLVGELDGGMLEHDALFYAVVRGKVASRNIADDDLQRNDLHLFDHGLPVVQLLHEMGGDAVLFQHLHEQVGHAVVDGAFAQDGALLLAVEGRCVILVLHDEAFGIIGAKHFLSFSFVDLFQLFHC